MKKNELLQHANWRLTTMAYLLLMLLHVHWRLAAALLPIITRPGSSLAHRLYLEYYQFGGKEKQWNTYQLLNFYLEMAYVTSNNVSLAKLRSMATLKFKSIEMYPRPTESSMPKREPGCLGNSCPTYHRSWEKWLSVFSPRQIEIMLNVCV